MVNSYRTLTAANSKLSLLIDDLAMKFPLLKHLPKVWENPLRVVDVDFNQLMAIAKQYQTCRTIPMRKPKTQDAYDNLKKQYPDIYNYINTKYQQGEPFFISVDQFPAWWHHPATEGTGRPGVIQLNLWETDPSCDNKERARAVVMWLDAVLKPFWLESNTRYHHISEIIRYGLVVVRNPKPNQSIPDTATTGHCHLLFRRDMLPSLLIDKLEKDILHH